MLAGYLRVSHLGRRKREALRSTIDQTAEIEAWAKAQGRQVEILEAEIDAKGGDASRPVFRQAVEGVKAGTYEGVVVAYLSRAGRDLRLMLDLWDEVEGAGGAVYFARENIDASTAAGRLHRNILASIAQHELEERREGFERDRASATERGIWQRRQTPRGYRRDPETRGLIPDDDADSIAAAARDLLAGTPISELADRLAMTTSGVRYLLRNRVYIGELRVGRHVNPNAHEPILDRQTFEAVQAKFGQRTRPAKSGRPGLLTGLVRCASCGHVMTRQGAKGGGRSYTCPKRHSGGHCPAPAGISEGRLDAYVEPIARAELQRVWTRIATGNRLAALQAEADAAHAERDAYLEAVDAAGLGASAAAAGMRSRQERVDRAEAEVRAEMARIPTLPAVRSGEEVWEDLSVHERNTVLRGLLACVVVRPVGSGRLVAVADRARVLRYGAECDLPASRGIHAGGIVPIWPDTDGDDVLGVAAGEDTLEGSGGAVEM